MKTRLLGARVLNARQRGLSLIEMMIAMTLGLLVMGLTTMSYLSMARSSTLQDEGSKVEQNGRFAIDAIVRTLRMSGYRDWNETTTVPAGYTGAVTTATIGGIDGTPYDTVSVRYFGAELPAGKTVPAVMDCTGAAIAANVAAFSTISVVDDGTGNGTGNLSCTDSSAITPVPQTLIGNVERLQFLYGLDTNGDEQVDTFVRATDLTTTALWNQVIAIRIALVVTGAANSAVIPDTAANQQLFGPDYACTNADACFTPTGAAQNRVRRLFTATVRVRNYTGPTTF